MLEGTLSADGLVVLKLYFGTDGVPTNPPTVGSNKVAYLVYWLDKDGNALKNVELRSGI